MIALWSRWTDGSRHAGRCCWGHLLHFLVLCHCCCCQEKGRGGSWWLGGRETERQTPAFHGTVPLLLRGGGGGVSGSGGGFRSTLLVIIGWRDREYEEGKEGDQKKKEPHLLSLLVSRAEWAETTVTFCICCKASMRGGEERRVVYTCCILFWHFNSFCFSIWVFSDHFWVSSCQVCMCLHKSFYADHQAACPLRFLHCVWFGDLQVRWDRNVVSGARCP